MTKKLNEKINKIGRDLYEVAESVVKLQEIVMRWQHDGIKKQTDEDNWNLSGEMDRMGWDVGTKSNAKIMCITLVDKIKQDIQSRRTWGNNPLLLFSEDMIQELHTLIDERVGDL